MFAGFTVMLRPLEFAEALVESVTLTVNEDVAALEAGVPVIVPLALSVRPAGSDPVTGVVDQV